MKEEISWFRALKMYMKDNSKEITELLDVWYARENDWLNRSDILKTLQEKYGEKQWHERKFDRWLAKCKDKILLKKKEGKNTYYRLYPKSREIATMLSSQQDFNEIIENVGENIRSTNFFPQINFLLGKFSGKDKYWLMASPRPFWEYSTNVSILGFPNENELLSIEKIIFNHIRKKLFDCFEELTWLRTMVLARKHLGVQLPLTEFIRNVIFEDIITTRPLPHRYLPNILNMSYRQLVECLKRKYGEMGGLIPPQQDKDVDIWETLENLRKKGFAKDFGVILMSGSQKALRKGDYIVFNAKKEEDGEVFPPLGTRGKNLIIPYPDNYKPSFSVKNLTPFPITPKMVFYGEKYKFKEVTDKKTLEKLRRGEIPSKELPS